MIQFENVEKEEIGLLYNNIAGVYKNQGDYVKALEWYEKALRIWVNKLSINHPHTNIVIDNMRYAYTALYGKDSDFDNWLKRKLQNFE